MQPVRQEARVTKRWLVMNRPKKKIADMTEEEIDAYADDIFEAMAANMKANEAKPPTLGNDASPKAS